MTDVKPWSEEELAAIRAVAYPSDLAPKAENSRRRWLATLDEARAEVARLQLLIRRARIRLDRGADAPAVADDPIGTAESINEAGNILRKATDGGQKTSERDAEPGVSTGQAQSPSNATPASAPKEPALSPAIPPRAASGGEAKDAKAPPERVWLYWCPSQLGGIHIDTHEGEWNGARKLPFEVVLVDLLASALAVLADTKAALEESRRVLTMRSEDLRRAHEALNRARGVSR